MAKSHYLSDAPQVTSHMIFLDDFHAGYSHAMNKINKGVSIHSIKSELRAGSIPVHDSMNDYFYEKGQWAAVMDSK